MRQMTGDRQHQVVMLGRHGFDIGAERAPERGEPLDGAGIGPFRRRENAPAVDEQLGKAGIGAGMLGAGDRMGRNEMHAGGQMRGHVAHDRALDRADIGNDRAGLEMGRDLLGDLAAGADRRADDDEIGAGDRRGVGFDHLIGETEFGDAPPRRCRARGRHDLAHRALRPRRARDRRADQADADQRQTIEQRRGFRHGVTPALPENP